MAFTVSWEAPEYEYHEKGVSWYWITIIIAACIIAFSVWERNFLFGFFVVIAEILVIAWGNREPAILIFTLDENGIAIGPRKFHSLKEFESWSADDLANGWAEIIFNFKNHIKIPLKILLPDDKLEEVKKNLKPILKEVEHQTTLIDAIEKLLRF